MHKAIAQTRTLMETLTNTYRLYDVAIALFTILPLVCVAPLPTL